MPPEAPLLSRPLSEAFCVFTDTGASSPSLSSPSPALNSISCAEFLIDVHSVAATLPDKTYAINLCSNRYSFLVTFCAVMVRGSTNLLPPNKNTATQQLLAELYSESYVLHNGDVSVAEGLESIAVEPRLLVPGAASNAATEGGVDVPTIPADHLAAISFTSGSTGRSQPNHKTWGSMVAGSAINSRYFLPASAPIYVLATVPAQHMWGLETSVYLPLFNNVCVSHGQPLFAQDIVNHLNALPEPRLLVSTPVHLRYLLASSVALPHIERALCATSPLEPSLARELESACAGELVEVYGCSEVGSMAYRNTSSTETWTTFEGLEFTVSPQGETHVVANHLPIRDVVLQDKLSFVSATQFQLLGRNSDDINIAGKRGSISEITQLLLAIDHVRDAAVLIINNRSTGIERLTAVVVGDIEKSAVLAALRKHLDPVFIPKVLHVVDCLPREASGKLPRQALLALIEKSAR